MVYGLPVEPGQRGDSDGYTDQQPRLLATGCCLLVCPLVDAGLLPADAALSIHGVSGYPAGAMIQVESAESGLVNLPFEAPYALNKCHKHLPEVQRYGRLGLSPTRPSVGAFARGMRIRFLHAPIAQRNRGDRR